MLHKRFVSQSASDSPKDSDLLDSARRQLKGQNQYGKVVLPKPHHHKIAGVLTQSDSEPGSLCHSPQMLCESCLLKLCNWMLGRIRAITQFSCNTLQHQIPFMSLSASSNSFNYHIKPYFLTLLIISLPFTFDQFQQHHLQPYHETVVGAGTVIQEHLGQHLRSPSSLGRLVWVPPWLPLISNITIPSQPLSPLTCLKILGEGRVKKKKKRFLVNLWRDSQLLYFNSISLQMKSVKIRYFTVKKK